AKLGVKNTLLSSADFNLKNIDKLVDAHMARTAKSGDCTLILAEGYSVVSFAVAKYALYDSMASPTKTITSPLSPYRSPSKIIELVVRFKRDTFPCSISDVKITNTFDQKARNVLPDVEDS
nr:hypothetical protein [Tanacetum cinerariifolium]